jgi:myo-inositol-1(or 4)-monophosphatase
MTADKTVLKEAQLFAENIARIAGPIIKENFSKVMQREWKTPTSPVTATDIAINKLVHEAIKERFPDHGYIGEEGGDSVREYTWICDPVDGTIPFSHGVPTCVFMLALTRNGAAVVGVIYDPFQDRLYSAAEGQGTTLNGKPVRVNSHASIRQAIYGIAGYLTAPYDVRGVYNHYMGTEAVDCGCGSIGYMDMLVASGEFSFVVFAGKEVWDSAAPDIIVREAGGKFTDLFGTTIDYRQPVRGHIAANRELHANVLDLVREKNIEN